MKKEIILSDKLIAKFKKYLLEQERSPNCISNYIRGIKSLQLYADGSPLTKDKLLKYKAFLANKYEPSTVNVAIAAVNSLLKCVDRQDLLLKPLKIQKNMFLSADRELSKADYEKLVVTANNSKQEQLSMAIQTICATGIRVSELQYITVAAVHLGKAEISNKGKCRTIFIPSSLCKLLKKYAQKKGISNGAIFVTGTGKPLDRSNLWKQMKALCEKAGVNAKKVYPHNLRHLFARTYYSKQKDISRLADILGHSNVNTTRIYTMESGLVHANQIESLGLVCVNNTTQCRLCGNNAN